MFIGLWSGIFMICPSLSEIHWLNRWTGAVGLSSWILYITTANLLAINRLVHICFHSIMANRIFSKVCTRVYLALVSCYAITWFFILTMTTDTEFVFACEYLSWIYGESSYSNLLSQVELYTDSANICCMMVWYVCIYVGIRAQYNKIQNVEQISKSRKDKKLLLQASTLCLMVSLVVVTFFCLPLLHDGIVTYVTITWVWISSAGVNSMIYLIFNKTIRIHVLRFIGLEQEMTTLQIQTGRLNVSNRSAVFEMAPRHSRVSACTSNPVLQ